MQTCNFSFNVSDAVLALGVRGVYFVMRNMRNRLSDQEFEKERLEVLEQIAATLSKESIKADPILEGFRLLHEKVGCSNKKFVASPENLLSMLAAKGTLPSINLLVDIYNLVSVETRLAIGAHDLTKISGNVHLRLTAGTEGFWPLGYNEPQNVGSGEYAYIDDANEIICRLEVRQVEKTKVTLNTNTADCFFIVQGNVLTTDEYIWGATQRLIDLVKRFCSGTDEILYRAGMIIPGSFVAMQ